MIPAKGTAIRVGNEIRVPPNATEADHDAAWAMMTPEEEKRYAKEIVRILKWTVWRMKHPKWAAVLDAIMSAGVLMYGRR